MPEQKRRVYLIVTIDTEEDDWGVYKPSGHQLTNIRCLPKLQKLFDTYKIRPTYLIDYPAAADETQMEFFKTLHGTGRAEIGAHLHPWNTPPFEEEPIKYNSMMKNLPRDLQKRKMAALTSIIERNLGIKPTSFRAGRFGIDQCALTILLELNYYVDSSVTPFINWENDYDGVNFQGYPYYPYPMGLQKETGKHPTNMILWEVPVTIGFNRTHFKLCNSIYNFLGQDNFRVLRLRGLTEKIGLLKKIWLSPEHSGHKEMQQLSKIFIRLGIIVLNMMFHSTSLVPGLSPFVKNIEQKKTLLNNIELYLTWLHDNYDVKSITLSDYPLIVKSELSTMNFKLRAMSY